MTGPALVAADPSSWLATHLAARHDAVVAADADDRPRRILGAVDLLADDGLVLCDLHAGLRRQGVPGPAAAMYLAGWFPGGIAGAVGYGLATGGAGFLVDAAEVRWQLHPDGWVERLELGAVRTAVEATHPWAGLDQVVVLDSSAEVAAAAVVALVDAVTPLVDGCRRLARVGRAGLWNEVGDALGTALAYELDLTVTPAMTAVLAAAVAMPGTPWRARPALRFATASFGSVHVVQRGGCCLAYTETHGGADHCLNCSLRDPADCDARQVAYLEEQHHERNHR